MNEELVEQLHKNHPRLFQKSRVDDIHCGDGWFNIIDNLLTCFEHDLTYQEELLKEYKERNVDPEGIRVATEEAQKALEKLPILFQIKEKFGRLKVFFTAAQQAYDT